MHLKGIHSKEIIAESHGSRFKYQCLWSIMYTVFWRPINVRRLFMMTPFHNSLPLFFSLRSLSTHDSDVRINTIPADCTTLLFCTLFPSSLIYLAMTPPFLPLSECFIVAKKIPRAGRTAKSGPPLFKNWDYFGIVETIKLLAAMRPWRPWNIGSMELK